MHTNLRWLICALLPLLLSCRQASEGTLENSRNGTAAPAPATTGPATTSRPADAPLPVERPDHCKPAPDVLCPADNASTDPSFEEFRRRLAAAVRAKDEAQLLALIDPNIRTSFGDSGGLAAFRGDWDPSAPGSRIWTELGKVLALGGTFRGEEPNRSFWAPYVYSTWPDSVDAFQYVAAVRRDVPIRTERSPAAPVIETVSWAILELMPRSSPGDGEWVHVKSPAGKAGWVLAADVHSPVGYRAGFAKSGGDWKMNAFVAGD